MKIKFVIFLLGITVFISGFILYVNGPRRYIQFENEFLGHWAEKISGGDSKEIVWFYTGKSTRYFVSNMTVLLDVSTEDGTFLFHILEEEQFGKWQENEKINQTMLSKLVDEKFGFSFNAEEDEKYHFVAENLLNITNSISISLWWEGDFLRFDYSLTPIHLFVLTLGLGVCLVLRKTYSSMLKNFLKEWSLPLYKPLGEKLRDKEEIALHFDAILRLKRASKYFVLALFSIIAFDFLRGLISQMDIIINLQPIRPEQRLLIIDLIIRNSILKAMLLFPFFIGIPLYLLLGIPRKSDLCDVLKSRFGWRRSRKQWLISKYLYKKLMRTMFSSRFLVFVLLILLPILLSYLFESQVLVLVFLTFGMAAMSIWIGYTVWSIFQESCIRNNIGKYAAERYMKISIFDWTVVALTGWACVSFIIFFATSNFWTSTIESFVFEPVALLEPFSEFIPAGEVQFSGVLSVFYILACFVFLGFLMFILFPYLHKMGRKGFLGAIVVFILTYLTEFLVGWGLQGTANVVFQPFGLITPIIAAVIAQIAQSKYNKIIKKRVARAKNSDQYAPQTM